MRGQGRVYRPKVRRAPPGTPYTETKVWLLDYSIGGQRHSESSGSTSKKDAFELLHQRIGDRKSGKLVGAPDRVVVAEYDDAKKLTGGLRAIAERQYTIDGRRSLARLKDAWANLEKFLHAETPALTITADRIDAYAVHRLGEGASAATVNYAEAAMRRALRVRIEKRLPAKLPAIQTPKVGHA